MPTDSDGSHERKLVTILAADVAGYSRLMADDDVATMLTLTEYREVFSERVTSHKGRIVDTAGDGVLAIFDSVIEPVQVAVDVQRQLADRNESLAGHRKMHFRIGVNLGDIIVRDDGTIYGDGVNVAARLEGLAAPGAVMISEDVHRYVDGKLDVGLADAGEHEVKNIAKPVRAYRVLLDGSEAGTAAPRPTTRSLRRPQVIAGLAAALAVVIGLAVWGLTSRVEAPQLVTDEGVPVLPTGPSIAVVPFDNLSGNSDQDYFSDGITEDILVALSRFRSLFVIGKDSTIRYKGNRSTQHRR